MKNNVPSIVIIAFIMFAFLNLLGCKSVSNIPSILPNVQVMPSDAEIVFAYNKGEKSGLYRVGITNSIVHELVSPIKGIIHDPCISGDGKSILFVFSEKAGDTYQDWIATTSSASSVMVKLFKSNHPITSIVASRISQRVYYVSSNNAGKSSPLVNSKLRNMQLNSSLLDGSGIRVESDFDAFQIGGKLNFDSEEKNIFMNIIFSNNSRVDGPYMYDIKNKNLKYIIDNKPQEYTYKEFLSPASSFDNKKIFLKGSYQVYESNSNSVPFSQSKEEQYRYQHAILGLCPFNSSNGFVINRKNTHDRFFVVVNEAGDQKEIAVDMRKFSNDFM